MASKLTVSELKKLAAEYHLCIKKCQDASRELRGNNNCSKKDGQAEPPAGFRIDVTSLSQRELEVFALIGYGLSTKQIAKRAAITASTVETYRERLKKKLNYQTASELMRAAVIWTVELGGQPIP